MNILHTETLRKWGGQQNRVLTEAVGLNKKGHKVIIACQKEGVLAEKARAAGIRVYEVNMEKHAHLITIPRLMNIILKEGIEIVSTHSSVDSWAGAIAAKLTGRHLVRFRHNLYPVGRDPLTQFIYAVPDRIIAISNAVKDVLTRCGVRGEKIKVINSSVDFEIFNPEAEDLRKELNIPPETVVIGNTSTFTGVKGQEYLLQAFNIINRRIRCILLFAGRLIEPFKSRYLSHVNSEFRDRVIFLGHRDDIPGVLKTMDVFVYPSFLEGLGTALLEAMAMERAVAVSDIPTFREFVESGVNGVYFKVKNPEEIAEKVITLLQNKELRQQLGRNARTTALKNFTIERMLDMTEAVYKEVLHAV